MNTVQLECFLSVSDTLNFARAAEHLHITQPAVTHQIHSLEEELGTRLFRRTTRSVELTPAGWNFIADAENILKLIHGATARISQTEQNAIQIFGIGAHKLLEPRFLPYILKDFIAACPPVHPSVRLIPHAALENMLKDESIDVLFGFQEKNIKQNNHTFCELCRVPTACVVMPEHPLAGRDRLMMKDLHSGPMIITDPRHNFNMLGNIQNQAAGFRPPSDLYFCDDVESALTLVKAGLGFHILPDLLPSRDPSLCYIPIMDAPEYIYGLFHKTRKRSPVLKKFISITRNYFSSDTA